jgi:hypothetical protein
MSTTERCAAIPVHGNGKRVGRLMTTVSSHMVNYPVGLQAQRPEQTRTSLISACAACRARSAA